MCPLLPQFTLSGLCVLSWFSDRLTINSENNNNNSNSEEIRTWFLILLVGGRFLHYLNHHNIMPKKFFFVFISQYDRISTFIIKSRLIF